MTTSQENRQRVGQPCCMDPTRAWWLVIEMIAKPALPWNGFSDTAWCATCRPQLRAFRPTPILALVWWLLAVP